MKTKTSTFIKALPLAFSLFAATFISSRQKNGGSLTTTTGPLINDVTYNGYFFPSIAVFH